MNIEFHTLHFNHPNNKQLSAHQKVMNHFGIHVNYDTNPRNHGDWLDFQMKNTKTEFVGFFDSDCVPITKEGFEESLKKVEKTGTFIGIAQASNHIKGHQNHIFAAPGFFVMSKDIYDTMNQPRLAGTQRSDAAQEATHVADEMGIKYDIIYPTHYEEGPAEMRGKPWNLGEYGYFGIGTVYGNVAYHLYQGRMRRHIDLFEKRCNEIVDGTFSTDNMHSSIK